jgi:hypothetical protein
MDTCVTIKEIAGNDIFYTVHAKAIKLEPLSRDSQRVGDPESFQACQTVK